MAFLLPRNGLTEKRLLEARCEDFRLTASPRFFLVTFYNEIFLAAGLAILISAYAVKAEARTEFDDLSLPKEGMTGKARELSQMIPH